MYSGVLLTKGRRQDFGLIWQHCTELCFLDVHGETSNLKNHWTVNSMSDDSTHLKSFNSPALTDLAVNNSYVPTIHIQQMWYTVYHTLFIMYTEVCLRFLHFTSFHFFAKKQTLEQKLLRQRTQFRTTPICILQTHPTYILLQLRQEQVYALLSPRSKSIHFCAGHNITTLTAPVHPLKIEKLLCTLYWKTTGHPL